MNLYALTAAEISTQAYKNAGRLVRKHSLVTDNFPFSNMDRYIIVAALVLIIVNGINACPAGSQIIGRMLIYLFLRV